MGGDLGLDGMKPGGPHAPTPHPPSRAGQPRTRLVQIGWQDEHGVMCDCPVYELSPHANSKPVYREEQVDE